MAADAEEEEEEEDGADEVRLASAAFAGVGSIGDDERSAAVCADCCGVSTSRCESTTSSLAARACAWA